MRKSIRCISVVLSLTVLLMSQSFATDFSSSALENKDSHFPFIYSDDADFDWFRTYIGDCSFCVPGHLYVKNLNTGEINELVDEPVQLLREAGDMLYCVTADGLSIIQTDYQSGQVEVLYNAAQSITNMEIQGSKLYFTEGDYVTFLDLVTNQTAVITLCPNISYLYPVSDTEFAWIAEGEDKTYLYNAALATTEEVEFDALFPGDSALNNLPITTGSENDLSGNMGNSAVLQESFPLSNYPVGSYFTYNGEACENHESCDYNGNCNCISYDSSIQCMAFAKYACDQYAHRSSWKYTVSHTDQTAHTYKSDSELRAILQELGPSAYLRLNKATGGQHSIVIISAGNSSVTIYESNYTDLCQVGIRTLTYAKFRSQYPSIAKTFAHSFDGRATKYDTTYHKVACSLSGCSSYIYQPHYSQSPGANATCLACGYVGYISSGIMSIGT